MKTLFLLLTILIFAVGCEAPECQQLQACCAEIKDVEGVGKSCDGLAKGVTDPGKCKSITQSVGYMFESKGNELPAVCKVEP